MGTKHSTLHKSDRYPSWQRMFFGFLPSETNCGLLGFGQNLQNRWGDLSSGIKESIRYYYTKINSFEVFFQHFKCHVCVVFFFFFFFNSSCLLFVLERTLVFLSCACSDQPLKY